MTERLGHSRQLALTFLLGALLVGGVVGFTADRFLVGDRLCQRSRAQMRAEFHEELGLTAAQAAAVDSMMDRKQQQISALMKPVRPQLKAISDSTHDQIKRLLTAEQQARLDDWRRRLDERKKAEKK